MGWYWDENGKPVWRDGAGPVVMSDPYKPRRDELGIQQAEQSISTGQSAEARAAADQAMQRERFEWERIEREKDRQAQTVANVRESEDKAASFLMRAKGADAQYRATGMGARGLVRQTLRDWTPNVQNAWLPEWGGGNSDARQIADSAQDEFIAATLRQDSGAAIPEEELERQRRIYFPMPGDDDAAIKAKAAARSRAIDGLKNSAGRRAPRAQDGFYKQEATQYPSTDAGEAEDALTKGERNMRRKIAEKARGMKPAQREAFTQQAWELYYSDPRIRGIKAAKSKPGGGSGWGKAKVVD